MPTNHCKGRIESCLDYLVLHGKPIALAFDPGPIDEDARIRLKTGEGDANSVVYLVDLPDRARVLKLGGRFLFDTCQDSDVIQESSAVSLRCDARFPSSLFPFSWEVFEADRNLHPQTSRMVRFRSIGSKRSRT